MIVLELDMVEIDHCVKCGGIWLDNGELELLFEDKQQANKLIESFNPKTNVSENLRPCPICDKKMQKAAATADIIIDRCERMHGLWFDKNELSQILAKNSLGNENKVMRLLSDIFSKEKK